MFFLPVLSLHFFGIGLAVFLFILIWIQIMIFDFSVENHLPAVKNSDATHCVIHDLDLEHRIVNNGTFQKCKSHNFAILWTNYYLKSRLKYH